jgi:hypothetical protein
VSYADPARSQQVIAVQKFIIVCTVYKVCVQLPQLIFQLEHIRIENYVKGHIFKDTYGLELKLLMLMSEVNNFN